MKKAELKNQLREMVKAKPKEGFPRLFLHTYNGQFKLHFELENCVRCLILSEAQAMKRIKEHKAKINITIYHVPGEPLPDIFKGIRANIVDILPGMVTPLTKWLTYQTPTLYDDQSIEDYSSRLTQEQKQIIGDMSRIQRILAHE